MNYSAFQIVLLNVCVLYGTTKTLDEGLDKYFEYLSDICLYSDICNATRKAEFESSDNDIPCCHSCSCDIGCVVDRNCCLDEMYVKNKTVEEKCINVDSSNVADTYLMVETCSNSVSDRYDDGSEMSDDGLKQNDDGSDRFVNGTELYDDGFEKNVANKSCADNIFLPVSSLKMNKVFANSLCARCNGASDAKVWDMMVATRGPIRPDQVSLFTNGHNLKSLRHRFLPPRNENWSHKKCQLTIETCYSGYSNDTIQSLCHSIEAPIKVGLNTYKNAFCALCNGIREDIIRRSRVCVASGTDRIPTSGFTTILNIKTLKRLSTSRTHVFSSTNTACSNIEVQAYNKTECLPLLCPVGMTRTDGHDCWYIGSKWNANYLLKVLLRKTHGKSLKPAFLGILKKTNGKSLLDMIDLPEPCKSFEFTGVMLYEEIVNNTDDNEELLAVLFKLGNGEGENPEKVMVSFRSCLNDNWQLTIKTEQFTFKPSLFQHKSIPDGITVLRKQGHTENGQSWRSTKKRFQFLHGHTVALRTFKLGSFVEIQKLYFCNQLYLPLGEVVFGYGELVIESTGKVLHDNEFFIIDDHRVAVCAEDYVMETTVVSCALQTKGFWVLNAVCVNLLIMALVI